MDLRGAEAFAVYDLEDVEDDLALMKGFAKRLVEHLVVNNCMLDIKQAGIEHLTCVKIEDAELPWIKKAGQ